MREYENVILDYQQTYLKDTNQQDECDMDKYRCFTKKVNQTEDKRLDKIAYNLSNQ